MSQSQDHLPLTAACHKLGISYKRAWSAVVSGAVVAVQEHGRWKIPADQLDALWSACSNGGGDHDDR